MKTQKNTCRAALWLSLKTKNPTLKKPWLLREVKMTEMRSLDCLQNPRGIYLRDLNVQTHNHSLVTDKVSATLQDRPRADRCSAFTFLINPNKPYIF